MGSKDFKVPHNLRPTVGDRSVKLTQAVSGTFKRGQKRSHSKLEVEVGRSRVLQEGRVQATEAARGVVVYAGTTGTAIGWQVHTQFCGTRQG